ncbi:hypothetical protein ACHAW5_008725 [Stephanodiscus triporus]|uniref:Uncharacterized protein n=1 Tax=Stephanodiscus triporus TaxID=2934178 RepID=A0ABD3NKK8_9STRA
MKDFDPSDKPLCYMLLAFLELGDSYFQCFIFFLVLTQLFLQRSIPGFVFFVKSEYLLQLLSLSL